MNTITNDSVQFVPLMQRLMGLLSEKEREILARRFSLNNTPRETLDTIGQSYAITRERVRQIESVALKKLARIFMDPKMQAVHDVVEGLVEAAGGVILESKLMEQVVAHISNGKPVDENAIKLSLRVSARFVYHSKSAEHRAYWRSAGTSVALLREVIHRVVQQLQKNPEKLFETDQIIESVSDSLPNAPEAMIRSVLPIDRVFMEKAGKWGLSKSRFINPKSIKDRILVTLNNANKPMHFRDIIAAVLKNFPSTKKVTSQAVHNELIRHDDFALVGRGLYGLTKWNMPTGTVCDIIISVLQENGGPMRRKDIIESVLKKRDIRIGTISLNLQKYDFFTRVGRAVYDYDASLDHRRRKR